MKKIIFPQIADKGIFFLAVSQFGMAFSNNFILVIMPFYILKVSPFNHQTTMLWIGVIMGGSSIATTLAAPFWGGLTARISPKLLFERGLFFSAVVILLMGFTENIYLIFILRILQGTLGGASTNGLILAAALSTPEKMRGNMSLFQNSITMGQLFGPPAGAYMTTLLGYRFPFFISFSLIFIFLIFCHLYVRYIPPQGEPSDTEASMRKSLFFGWLLCMIGTVHLIFMPSVLPHILGTFRLGEKEALGAAGMVMMAYTGSAVVGSYFLCNLSSRIGLKKIMILSLVMASVFQILLIFSTGVFSFVILRVFQCAFIAAVFPLTISAFARHVGGKMIGFLNSARFFGNAVGPIMATSILAFAGLPALYLSVAGLTLCALWFFHASMRTGEA